MSAAQATSAGLWLETRIDWSWPGTAVAVEPPQPPTWVPAVATPAAIPVAAAPVVVAPPRRRASSRRLQRRAGQLAALTALFASALAVFVVLARPSVAHPRAHVAARVAAVGTAAPPLPAMRWVSTDSAHSTISTVAFASTALSGEGSFLVYLPPAFKRTSRYPVLYLLHGNGEQAGSFLALGLQQALDAVSKPVIAVMINGGPGANNWRNEGHGANWASYVIEVQQLIDRMLPTVASRDGRAIAGYSMGGYGAMRIALEHLDTFAVAESWLGFFDGLAPRIAGDRAVLASEPLHAFVWGAASDPIANAGENAPFAAALNGAGASAQSAVYPGSHDFATIEQHIGAMVSFAAGQLSSR